MEVETQTTSIIQQNIKPLRKLTCKYYATFPTRGALHIKTPTMLGNTTHNLPPNTLGTKHFLGDFFQSTIFNW